MSSHVKVKSPSDFSIYQMVVSEVRRESLDRETFVKEEFNTVLLDEIHSYCFSLVHESVLVFFPRIKGAFSLKGSI